MALFSPLPLAAFPLVACLSLWGCEGAAESPWDFAALDLPPEFPLPQVPADNPMTAAKIELGRRLFYDTRLSLNGSQSCASCHQQAHAFAEPLAISVGSTGQAHTRNANSLTNVAYNAALTWANPLLTHLEGQSLIPLFGETPVELGFSNREDLLFERLSADPDYVTRFKDAFPEVKGAITLSTLTKALGAFQRTLISANSPWDDFLYRGDSQALSPEALRGMALFFSERLECFHCHGDFNFQSGSRYQGSTFEELTFHNNGLYNVGGQGHYPNGEMGLAEITGQPRDLGRFRAPTLRNLRYSAPYMHDGSVGTLEEVIAIYAAGGRNITEGSLAGDGRTHPNRSPFVRGFEISPQETKDLIAFLESLSDEDFVTHPRWSNPFLAKEPNSESP